jgi:hypothetical protein
VSLGLGNTEADIARLGETLARITARKASSGNRVLARLHLGTPFLPAEPTGACICGAVSQAVAQVYSPVPTAQFNRVRPEVA